MLRSVLVGLIGGFLALSSSAMAQTAPASATAECPSGVFSLIDGKEICAEAAYADPYTVAERSDAVEGNVETMVIVEFKPASEWTPADDKACRDSGGEPLRFVGDRIFCAPS